MLPDPMEEEVRREMGVMTEWSREMCSEAMRDLKRMAGQWSCCQVEGAHSWVVCQCILGEDYLSMRHSLPAIHLCVSRESFRIQTRRHR